MRVAPFDAILYHHVVLKRVQACVVHAIEVDRCGGVVTWSILKDVVGVFVACGMKKECDLGGDDAKNGSACYDGDLERVVLDASKVFYEKWSSVEISDGKTVFDYLLKVGNIF